MSRPYSAAGRNWVFSKCRETIRVANLAISTLCNQSCPYCFTLDYQNMSRSSSRHFLALEELGKRLAFLKRSGIDQVRLMGGEPTLHPQFINLVQEIRKEGRKIVIFSNGLMPTDVLGYLTSLPVTESAVLVNVNDPQITPPNVQARQLATIRQLGERATLGFNIYRPDFQLDFLLAMISQAGCHPAARLGIAHPCLSGNNQDIHPNQYVPIGFKIARFARLAATAGVTVEFDCGFVRCMFSEQDLQALRSVKADVGWRCNPILDIDIAGYALYCYPLARLGGLPLTADADAQSYRRAFELRTRPYRQAGIFPECSRCPFQASGECPGGCLSATIRRFRRAPSSRLVVFERERGQ